MVELIQSRHLSLRTHVTREFLYYYCHYFRVGPHLLCHLAEMKSIHIAGLYWDGIAMISLPYITWLWRLYVHTVIENRDGHIQYSFVLYPWGRDPGPNITQNKNDTNLWNFK